MPSVGQCCASDCFTVQVTEFMQKLILSAFFHACIGPNSYDFIFQFKGFMHEHESLFLFYLFFILFQEEMLLFEQILCFLQA